jgi:hypothetical protein
VLVWVTSGVSPASDGTASWIELPAAACTEIPRYSDPEAVERISEDRRLKA